MTRSEYRFKRPCCPALTIAFVALLGGMVVPAASQDRRPAGSTPTSTATSREAATPLAQKAMLHAFYAKRRDPRMLLEQMHFFTLVADGADATEVEEALLAKRAEWAGLTSTAASGRYELGKWTKATLLTGARALSQHYKLGSAGVEPMKAAIESVEGWLSGAAVSRAAHRRLEQERNQLGDGSEEDAYGAVVAGFSNLPPAVQEVWCRAFCGVYGFRPDATDSEVMDNYPEFRDSENLARILERTEREATTNELVLRVLSDLHEDRHSARVAADRERETEEGRRRRQVEREGEHAAVDLLASFASPELASQIRAVNGAVFAVREAAESFEEARRIGADLNLASITLAWNAVGAATVLASALMDSSPSIDEVILEEVGKLREDVHILRMEVRDGFNRVGGDMRTGFETAREHLDLVYEDVIAGLDILRRENGGGFRDVIKRFEDSEERLQEIAGVQLDMLVHLANGIERLSRKHDIDVEAECERSYSPPVDRMTATRFADCRRRYELWGHELDKQDDREELARSTRLERLKSGTPAERMALSFAEFKRLLKLAGRGERAERLARTVVDPMEWFDVVDAHDRLLWQYPELVSEPFRAEMEEFADEMDAQRRALMDYAEVIVEELQAFLDDRRDNVFAELFEEVWNREAVNELLTETVGGASDNLLECYWAAVRRPRGIQALGTESCEPDAAELLGSEGFRDVELGLAMAALDIRSWLAFAFDDRVYRSEVLYAVVAGLIGLPDVRQMIESVGLRSSMWSWTLFDDVDALIENLENELRSGSMREVVARGYGHRVLTGMRFGNLDRQGDAGE